MLSEAASTQPIPPPPYLIPNSGITAPGDLNANSQDLCLCCEGMGETGCLKTTQGPGDFCHPSDKL